MTEAHIENAIDDLAPARAARWLLWSVVGFTILIILWAAFAQIDRTVRGTGRVIPGAQLQTVSTLESGVIERIFVKAGALVQRGQPLLRLDATEPRAEFASGEATANALRAKIARLNGEVSGRAPDFPLATDSQSVAQIAIERELYNARMADLASLTQANEARIVQSERSVAEASAEHGAALAARTAARTELGIVRSLVDRGIEPRLSLVQAEARLVADEGRVQAASALIARNQAAVVEARAGRARARHEWRTLAATALAAAQTELNALEKSSPALRRRVDRTVVSAPLAGRINRVLINTVGSAVSPGQPLVELVPSRGQLLVEARIRAQDIAQVRIGQEARVALTAYDQSVHGTLRGEVTNISPDSLIDERTGDVFYEVRVRTLEDHLASPTGQRLPIGAGMVTEVSVVGERRSVLSYILTPVTRLSERAFRE